MLSNSEANEEEMKPEKSGSEDETEVEKEAAIQKVCSATGCSVSIEYPFFLKKNSRECLSWTISLLQPQIGMHFVLDSNAYCVWILNSFVRFVLQSLKKICFEILQSLFHKLSSHSGCLVLAVVIR